MLDHITTCQLLLTVAARQAGSAEAFERLYREYAPLLLGVARRIVRRRELAEEVLHDAFEKVRRRSTTHRALAAGVPR